MAVDGLSLAAGLLMLLALAVPTYSVKNAIILFILAPRISPVGIPMIAVGVLAVLNKSACCGFERDWVTTKKDEAHCAIPRVSLVFSLFFFPEIPTICIFHI